MRMSKAKAEHYRSVADEYVATIGSKEYAVSEVVTWGMQNGKLAFSREDIFDTHAERMSESLRLDTTTDGQGRKVRLRHCVETKEKDAEGKTEQRILWAHIDDATDDFLLTALMQRHDKIKKDVQSLKADLDFLNARRAAAGKRLIQMSFNFTEEESDAVSDCGTVENG